MFDPITINALASGAFAAILSQAQTPDAAWTWRAEGVDLVAVGYALVDPRRHRLLAPRLTPQNQWPIRRRSGLLLCGRLFAVRIDFDLGYDCRDFLYVIRPLLLDPACLIPPRALVLDQ